MFVQRDLSFLYLLSKCGKHSLSIIKFYFLHDSLYLHETTLPHVIHLFCSFSKMDLFNLEILFWNVRGLRNNKKRKKCFKWVSKHTSSNSIIMLQETQSHRRRNYLEKGDRLP